MKDFLIGGAEVNLRRIHSSPRPFSEFTPVLQQRVDIKPRGLWYGIGWEWKEFCAGSKVFKGRCKYSYELDVDDSKLLVLPRDMSMEDFQEQYTRDIPGLESPSQRFRMLVDWPLIAAKYSGIEIPVYMWDYRMDMMWYYGWDVASGCIWNADALRGFTKIKAEKHKCEVK